MIDKHSYVEKPATIEAALFEGGAPNGPEIVSWVQENNGTAIWYGEEPGRPERLIVLDEFGGFATAYPGNYIVKERSGNFTVFSLDQLTSDWEQQS